MATRRIMTLSDSIYLQTSLNVPTSHHPVLLRQYLHDNDCSHFSFSYIFAKFVTKKCPLLDISTLTTCCALICCHMCRPPALQLLDSPIGSTSAVFVQHLPSKRRAAAGLTSKMASGEVPRVTMKCECDSAGVVWIRFVLICESWEIPALWDL